MSNSRPTLSTLFDRIPAPVRDTEVHYEEKLTHQPILPESLMKTIGGVEDDGFEEIDNSAKQIAENFLASFVGEMCEKAGKMSEKTMSHRANWFEIFYVKLCSEWKEKVLEHISESDFEEFVADGVENLVAEVRMILKLDEKEAISVDLEVDEFIRGLEVSEVRELMMGVMEEMAVNFLKEIEGDVVVGMTSGFRDFEKTGFEQRVSANLMALSGELEEAMGEINGKGLDDWWKVSCRPVLDHYQEVFGKIHSELGRVFEKVFGRLGVVLNEKIRSLAEETGKIGVSDEELEEREKILLGLNSAIEQAKGELVSIENYRQEIAEQVQSLLSEVTALGIQKDSLQVEVSGVERQLDMARGKLEEMGLLKDNYNESWRQIAKREKENNETYVDVAALNSLVAAMQFDLSDRDISDYLEECGLDGGFLFSLLKSEEPGVFVSNELLTNLGIASLTLEGELPEFRTIRGQTRMVYCTDSMIKILVGIEPEFMIYDSSNVRYRIAKKTGLSISRLGVLSNPKQIPSISKEEIFKLMKAALEAK